MKKTEYVIMDYEKAKMKSHRAVNYKKRITPPNLGYIEIKKGYIKEEKGDLIKGPRPNNLVVDESKPWMGLYPLLDTRTGKYLPAPENWFEPKEKVVRHEFSMRDFALIIAIILLTCGLTMIACSLVGV